MKATGFILAVLFFLSADMHLYGQNSIVISGKSLPELRKTSAPPAKTSLGWLPFFAFEKRNHALSDLKASQVPLVYSYDHLPIFCKIEVRLERTVHLPVKIRLGDVQYVDWLEGKRPSPGNN